MTSLLNEAGVNIPHLHSVTGLPEPRPLQFIWDGLLPAGFPSILFGDGGVGKSVLAEALAIHVAAGIPFLGRDVLKGTVIFIDAELDLDEFIRRGRKLARGMGLDDLPQQLLYYHLTGSVLSEEHLRNITDSIAVFAPALIIIDSVTAATLGIDPNAATEMTNFMKTVSRWGTTLLIDHVPKGAPGTGGSAQRAFGSVFKFNFSRSAIQVTSTPPAEIVVRQVKSNFSTLVPAIRVTVARGEGAMRIEVIGEEHGPEVIARSSTSDKLLEALRGSETGLTVEELAHHLGIAAKTVKNRISELRPQITSVHGRFKLAPPHPSGDQRPALPASH